MSAPRQTLFGQFEEVRSSWTAAATPMGLEDVYSRLIDEWRAVEWRSGGTTLLSAMGLQFNELFLCRGLAWLLDPEGGHGMGPHVLNAVMDKVGLPAISDSNTHVRVEESRADTRADIVVRTTRSLLVIEAKVLAAEQPQQADRLAQHWAHENSAFVFLTRTGQIPYTALRSADQWTALTWRELAQLARTVAAESELQPSAGAQEFIETIGAL
ncbi:MAG: hypothetical protein EOL91_07545 [Actinobacteria bacterium]|nr:hypothetical protein [Actinomycetota bacterium]